MEPENLGTGNLDLPKCDGADNSLVSRLFSEVGTQDTSKKQSLTFLEALNQIHQAVSRVEVRDRCGLLETDPEAALWLIGAQMPTKYDQAVNGLREGKITVEQHRDLMLSMITDFVVAKAHSELDDVFAESD